MIDIVVKCDEEIGRLLKTGGRSLYYLGSSIYDSRMITADEFRSIALALPEAEESSHMQHPDFRVGGKIFATLGPDGSWGMAKLTPAQQQEFLRVDPVSFKPAAGAWGERGATIITLALADEDDVRNALRLAWQNTAQKHLQNHEL